MGILEDVVADVYLMGKTGTLTITQLGQMCRFNKVQGHLAILKNPYLQWVIDGKKIVESRFSRNRIAPFEKVYDGHVLFLKESGGPIRAVALVDGIYYSGPLDEGEFEFICHRHAKGLMLEDDYKVLKRDCRYASLIFIDSVLKIEPVQVVKKDQRAWVVLRKD